MTILMEAYGYPSELLFHLLLLDRLVLRGWEKYQIQKYRQAVCRQSCFASTKLSPVYPM
ncbi:hypothetical protein IF2G_06807 [Cordyceps javanica]|nr:hypothetical protein IF2G_06807 [Cordyceps javanica]